MIPSSDQLEAFLDRIQALDKELAKLRNAEVRKAETIAEVRSMSKDWLKFSESLRSTGAVPQENLEFVDDLLEKALQSTDVRTRSSSYRKNLGPVVSQFTDRIIIPIIRYEGSPSQVASRELLREFTGKVSADEQAYLDEAARCLASKCPRAAIIMIWAATVARMHGAIEKVGFNAYNVGLDHATQKKGHPFNKVSKATISSLPELQKSRDYDLIVVGMELWKYDLQVFEELERLLGVRNGAAHPGMLKPTALDVQQYALKVNACVFEKIPY
jgi:hypothetical protein